MATVITQFTYKPLQKSDRLVFSKKVPFDQLAKFKTVVKFTIAHKDTTPYDNGLTFNIDPVGYNPAPTPATGGNLGSGSHVFGVLFDHKSENPDYSNLEILIDYTTWSSVLVPKEFLGKELTLTASYVADTHEIKVSITYGSKTFQVILTYDLALILEGVVEGIILTPSKVVVSSWKFKWTSTNCNCTNFPVVSNVTDTPATPGKSTPKTTAEEPIVDVTEDRHTSSGDDEIRHDAGAQGAN